MVLSEIELIEHLTAEITKAETNYKAETDNTLKQWFEGRLDTLTELLETLTKPKKATNTPKKVLRLN